MGKQHPNQRVRLRPATRNDAYYITPERLLNVVRCVTTYIQDSNEALALSRSLTKAAKQFLGVIGDREKLWHLPADYQERLVATGIDPETWFIVDRRRLARAWAQLLETGRLDLELLKKQNAENYEAPQMENLAVKTAPFVRIAGGKAQMVEQTPNTVENHYLQRQIREHFFDPLE